MNLHQHPDAFNTLIENILEKHNYRNDVLEKDYYVTLMLKELADNQTKGLRAYFKGGTALYKALKSIRRFSEDIDLTLSFEGNISKNQKKNRLELTAKNYKSLKRMGPCDTKGQGAMTCDFEYNSMYDISTDDRLERFGKVKVEATSFTVSEPSISLEITPAIYELASKEDRKTLEEVYDVKPFYLQTITLERNFVDKVFATEYYFLRDDELFHVAKHLYDLTVLLERKEIQELFKDKSNLLHLIKLKRLEEESRLGGIPNDKKIANFEYFSQVIEYKGFKESFIEMQRIYVFDNKDIIDFERITDTLEQVFSVFSEF